MVKSFQTNKISYVSPRPLTKRMDPVLIDPFVFSTSRKACFKKLLKNEYTVIEGFNRLEKAILHVICL